MLPKIEHPIHEIELSSIKKTVKFRPFLVKEEKILLMALEANDETSMINAIRQIIQNCVIEPQNFSVDDLAIYDLEYFFIKLRAHSMGEIIETKYTCQQVAPESGEKCGNLMDVKVNLFDVKLKNMDCNPIIKFTDKIGVKMKHPNINSLQQMSEINFSESVKNVIDFIYDCVDSAFDENQTYAKDEISREEFTEFVENMTKNDFDKFEAYFTSLPKLSHVIEKGCSRCGFEHKIVLEGIGDFFD
jgi:hypothetical protein